MYRQLLPLFFFLFSFVAAHAQQTERLIDNNPNYFYRGDQRPEGITAPADSNYMLVSYYQIAPNGVSQFGTLGTPVWIHRDSLINRGFFDGIGGSTSIEAGAGIILSGTGTEGDPYIVTNAGSGGGDNIYNTNGTVLADRTVTAQDQNTFLNFKDFDYINISNPETDDNIGLRIAGDGTPGFDNRLLVLSDSKGQDSVIFYRAYKGGAGGFDIISTDITTLQAPVLVLRGTNSELSVSNGIFTDGNNSRGLAYAADYSANYGDRSIPDVEYVNNQASGVNTIYNQNGTVSGNRTVTVGTGNSLNITTQNGDGQIFMQDGTGLQISGNTSTAGGRESVSFPNTGGGMQYQSNYNNKAGFGDRSIPDWGYISTHTVDALSSLSDTTAAANNVGRIVHVVDIDQKWTVNSSGSWEVLSGEPTAAEVTTTAINYERNTVANVQQGLADIDSNLIELSGVVNVPQEIGITLPFSIYKTGRDTSATYTITEDFPLQDFATCPAVDTLYVDPSTGNDTNDGQSFSTPLFSIDKAIELINTSGQCHHVELKEGEVFTAESGWENIIANVEFSMNCNNSLIHDDQQHLLGAWSAVFNYYQATLNGTNISGVVDTTQTNSFGEFLSLTEVSSTAEVNTTNNSWYEDGTNIYINTNSNTAPDGRIIVSGGSAYEWDIEASAGSFYIKNARTEGVTIRTRNSGGRYTLAIDSSEMTRPSGSLIWGVDSYFFNSLFHGGTGDLINLDVESGYIAKHVDYNNTYYHNTEDNTADACGNCQLSTGHQDTRLVQINTKFGILPAGAGVQRDNVTGQPVAHVTGSKFLMVGCDIGGSQSNGLTINSNVKAWIEGTNARLQDNGNDLQVDAGCIAFLKGNYFPTISNSGTMSNYYYNPATKKIQPYQIEGIIGIDKDTALAGGANRIPTSEAIAAKIENTKNALQSAIEAVLPTGLQGQSVFFNASDELAASNFLYHDQANNRLGMNTTTPSAFFEAETGAGNVYFRFDAQTSGQDVGIQLNDGAGQSWTIGTNNTNNSGSLNITTLDGISSPTRLILARNGYLGLGLNNTQPSDRLEVVGSVNSSAGYKLAGAAISGEYLRGNGTNFVSSTIQEADLPDRPISAITGLAHNVTTATTDASGDIVVTHGLGVTPTTVLITGGTNDHRSYQVLEASKNSTTFTVRVYNAGSPLNTGSATFNWLAMQ